MFKKKRIAAENHLTNGSDTLADLQQTYSDEAAKQFLEIQETQDSAEKILKLRSARSRINSMISDVNSKLSEIAGDHVIKYRPAMRKVRDSLGSDFYISSPRFYQERETVADQLKERADTNTFLSDMKALNDNVDEMLAATVRNCDLEEVSGSPYFPDAYKQHEQLRDRFAAATAARAALGDAARTAQKKESKAPAATDQPAASDKAAPEEKKLRLQKKIGSYDHLKHIKPPRK